MLCKLLTSFNKIVLYGSINLGHGSRKGFSGGSQKIIGVYTGSHLATGDLGLGLGAPAPSWSRGSAPVGVQGATLLPIFEHGLQFSYSDLMKSLIFWSINL